MTLLLPLAISIAAFVVSGAVAALFGDRLYGWLAPRVPRAAAFAIALGVSLALLGVVSLLVALTVFGWALAGEID